MASMAHIETKIEDSNGHGFLPQSADTRHDSEESSQSRSPLASFGFLKGLSGEKKLKADGQPPKRRGPKPDSKPALTRRQELNRQAQRTHRERKELYIKALEQEVLRLKETFGTVCKERDTYAEENQKLRSLLAANGIACPDNLVTPPTTQPADSTEGLSVTGNPAESSAQEMTPHSAVTQRPSQSPQVGNGQIASVTPIDYDQVGINFVLALEKPCMDHMQLLCTRSQTSDGDISGHALMATCPPASHTQEHPDVQYPHQMPEMNKSDLMNLLDLSSRLPLDGEITPVMAWSYILKDHRFKYLTEKDFTDMKTNLESKIRCYGFGAVLEEFEVRDAIESVFAARELRGRANVPNTAPIAE